MKLMFTLRTAFIDLQRNRLRSSLTMLGIVIGVAAVIIMVSVGQGAKTAVENQIASLGTNVIFVGSGSVTAGGQRQGFGTTQTLTVEDAEVINRECSAVMQATPGLSAGAGLVYNNQNWSASMIGVAPAYFVIRDLKLSSGTYFTEADLTGSAKVCVLGSEVADHLFLGEDPVGKTIRVKKVPFKVLGVLEAKGQTALGQNLDDTLYLPYTTVMKRLLNRTYVQFILVSAMSQDQIPEAKMQMTDLLRQRHRIGPHDDDDFYMTDQKDYSAIATATSMILTVLLGSVASISLIVGGIGIMNIMLVSVRERTREIGIRMAVGARGGDVLRQFLTESIVLSGVGGTVGVLLGIGFSYLISALFGLVTYVSPWSVLLAFGSSSAIGVFFGYYPALTASRLNPIDALRYE